VPVDFTISVLHFFREMVFGWPMANVTLSLPDDLLREVRHLAVDEGLSLSRFVARYLEQRVDGVRRFRSAQQRQAELLRDGLELGTRGSVTWSRDALHER
jgi:hypothetical protein